MSSPPPKTLEQWAALFERADLRQRLKERALDAISNGVLITDPSLSDNPIIYMNEAFARLTGYAPDEVIGRNCRFLQGEDRDQPDLPRIRHAIASGTPVHAVLRNYRKDGTMFWNELFIAPVLDDDGLTTHFVGVQQDVTERKQLTQQLEDQLQKLQELDRMKGLFISAISHELRTPLTSIKGFSEFLEDGIGGALSLEQQDFVRQIRSSVARLQRLVDDLLDAARLEGGTFRLSKQAMDFCGKLRDVTDEFRPQAEQAGITLTVDCPQTPLLIHADAQRITQVLTNLLSNAVKFSPEGQLVRVEVEASRDGLYCRVVDYGVGIQPSEVSQLFRPFVQLASGTYQSGGTGLGLSISKSIIEAHQGRIGVDTRPDGCTFWFFLPTSSAPIDPAG